MPHSDASTQSSQAGIQRILSSSSSVVAPSPFHPRSEEAPRKTLLHSSTQPTHRVETDLQEATFADSEEKDDEYFQRLPIPTSGFSLKPKKKRRKPPRRRRLNTETHHSSEPQGPSSSNSTHSSRLKTTTEIQKRTKEATKNSYVLFETSIDRIIQEYGDDAPDNKLTDLTSALEIKNRDTHNHQSNELHTLALSIRSVENMDSANVKQYKKNIRLSTYCMAKVIDDDAEKKYKRLFLNTIQGESYFDPKKWSVWKILFFTAFIAVLVTALLTGAFSILYAIAYSGTHVASTMGILNLFQTGWVQILPYRYLIPTVCGFLCSIISGYCFRKTETEAAVSRLATEIQPNDPVDFQSDYPDTLASLNLLKTTINKIKNEELKHDLSKLHDSLYKNFTRFRRKEATFINYLNPIIFATTLFARRLVKDQSNPSMLSNQKKKLLLDSLIGASLVQEPTEGWISKTFTPWIPALIVMAFFFTAFIPAFLIGYMSLNNLLLVSPLFSFFSLLPYQQTESTLSNKIKNYFRPNSIQKIVFSIKKTLEKSSVIALNEMPPKTPSRKNSLESGSKIEARRQLSFSSNTSSSISKRPHRIHLFRPRSSEEKNRRRKRTQIHLTKRSLSYGSSS
ncbi:MAG: hypothetical protein K0R24_455 [Gammaproteobacteria bacterium]|nr:hypothetical protein [Gammaproteobacteria bacterium]